MFAGVVMLIGAVARQRHEGDRATSCCSRSARSSGSGHCRCSRSPRSAQAGGAARGTRRSGKRDADRVRRRSRVALARLVRADARRHRSTTPTSSSARRLAVVGTVTGAYHHLAAPTIAQRDAVRDCTRLLNEVATFFVIAAARRSPRCVRLWRARRPRRCSRTCSCRSSSRTSCSSSAHFYVQPRFASYLLFHVLVLLAIGVQQIWDVLAGVVTRARSSPRSLIARVRGRRARSRVATVTRGSRRRCRGRTTSSSPSVAKATGINYVFTDSTHPGALYYYLGANRVVRAARGRGATKQAFCAVTVRFIFVDDQYHQAVTPNLKCLTDRHAVKIDVPQQLAPADPPARRAHRVPRARRTSREGGKRAQRRSRPRHAAG